MDIAMLELNFFHGNISSPFLILTLLTSIRHVHSDSNTHDKTIKYKYPCVMIIKFASGCYQFFKKLSINKQNFVVCTSMRTFKI